MHATTFDRKLDAERFLSRAHADLQRGEWVDPRLGQITVGEWVEHWLPTLQLRPTTRALYESELELHVLPSFKQVALGRLTKVQLQRWLAEQLQGPGSTASVRRQFRLIKQLLGAAVDSELIVKSPAAGIALPRVEAAEMRALSYAEVLEVANAMEPHYRVLILTLA
ncbi:MAG: site-specific integrase, partial [Acidimicrobiia bacterium]|nr:site-specific integrase [Acidimicrobiia bacterium]